MVFYCVEEDRGPLPTLCLNLENFEANSEGWNLKKDLNPRGGKSISNRLVGNVVYTALWFLVFLFFVLRKIYSSGLLAAWLD